MDPLSFRSIRKKTHTDRYLHDVSHHHSSQKYVVLNILIIKIFQIYNKDHLEKEKVHLKQP